MIDVAVIGAGVMGAATALAAARRGLKTVLLERFWVGHRHGSSHGQSRIMRLSYDDTEYIELARKAYRGWYGLQRATGRRLLTRTGGLDFGTDLGAVEQAMKATRVPFTKLSTAQLAQRYPQLRLARDMYGLYHHNGAVLSADQCVSALVLEAARHGCEIRERTRARIDGIRARSIIVAAGSWVNDVLTGTGFALPVTVTLEQVAYYSVPEIVYLPHRFPVTIEHRRRHPFMISVFPELASGTGIKVMRDRDGPPIDPENLDRTPRESGLELLTEHVRRRLRAVGPIRRAETCRYTMMPDGNFVLRLVPGQPRIAVVSACSGHGFKFAPEIGERAVDLVS